MPKNEEFKKVWAKVVTKAWSDASFKKHLLENPVEVLKAEGLDLSKYKKVVVNECSSQNLYLTLPEKPSGELSEEKLKEIAAGHFPMSEVR